MMYSLDIPKWMRDMLDKDLQLVKDKMDDHGKSLWEGSNGMEILIKV